MNNPIKKVTVDKSKNQPAIILVKTQLAQNIGATARAMLNFGLTDLRLVTPQEDHLSQSARSMAVGGDALLEAAQIYDTPEAAVQDLQVVFATTARPRDMTKTVTSPRLAMQEFHQLIQQGVRCGIFFGREKSGLKNHEIALCEKVIEIPVNPSFSSLNLSQAVIVLAYEWFQAHLSGGLQKEKIKKGDARHASKGELISFFERLEGELDANGFLRVPEKRDVMVRNIRNMFLRTHLTVQEVRTLHGILSSLLLYSHPKE